MCEEKIVAALHCAVWCGVVWCGVVWCGVVLCSLTCWGADRARVWFCSKCAASSVNRRHPRVSWSRGQRRDTQRHRHTGGERGEVSQCGGQFRQAGRGWVSERATA